MKIQYAFTARTDVKVPNTWRLRTIQTSYLEVKNLNFSILFVKISPKTFPYYHISLHVVLVTKR